MALISVSRAVKLFDVSRPTLIKALKEGKISGNHKEINGSSTWQIDTSELARLYSLRKPSEDVERPKDLEASPKVEDEKPSVIEGLQAELYRQIEGLRAEVEEAKAAAKAAEADKIEAEREALTAKTLAEERKRLLDDMIKLLPKPEPETPALPPGFWARIFRR